MAKQLKREEDVATVKKEVAQLTEFVNHNMWDPESHFYYDRFREGTLSDLKSIAAYWALLAEIVPENQLRQFLTHLENEKEFDRLHRIPTLSADASEYHPEGGYWRGGVWAPTNYMVLCGLSAYKQDSLAHVIALNHLDQVVKVFSQTGALWENYAPDKVQGNDKKDMVGWSGLVPISVLFEYVFGIRPTQEKDTIIWDIQLTDEFGVKQYPYKQQGLIDFWCAKRKQPTDEPEVIISSNRTFNLKLIWKNGSKIIPVKAR